VYESAEYFEGERGGEAVGALGILVLSLCMSSSDGAEGGVHCTYRASKA
jgi:hypothetical protein